MKGAFITFLVCLAAVVVGVLLIVPFVRGL